jgi:hypothetical protein
MKYDKAVCVFVLGIPTKFILLVKVCHSEVSLSRPLLTDYKTQAPGLLYRRTGCILIGYLIQANTERTQHRTAQTTRKWWCTVLAAAQRVTMVRGWDIVFCQGRCVHGCACACVCVRAVRVCGECMVYVCVWHSVLSAVSQPSSWSEMQLCKAQLENRKIDRQCQNTERRGEYTLLLLHNMGLVIFSSFRC